MKERKLIRIQRIKDQGKETDLKHITASERIGMMWQLTQDAWAFKGESIAESGLQRYVVNILRRAS